MAPARDAILQAVQRGNEAAARAYLADGGDPSAAFTQGPVAGLTLLMAASNFGKPGMVDLLLEHGASLDARASNGMTALMAAAYFGEAAIVRKLLRGGANTRLRNESGLTAMEIAHRRGHAECVKAFRPQGGHKVLPRDVVHAADRGEEEGVLVWLDDHGGDLAALDEWGTTNSLLMIAASGGHERLAHTLLLRGAAIDQINFDGSTALMLTANAGHEGMVDLLLGRGAEINKQDSDGGTALINAAYHGHPTVVLRLLRAGADMATRDVTGRTALQYAKLKGHAECEQAIRTHLQEVAGRRARAGDWSAEQRREFEDLLARFPKLTEEHWDRIAEGMDAYSKTRDECVARYVQISAAEDWKMPLMLTQEIKMAALAGDEATVLAWLIDGGRGNGIFTLEVGDCSGEVTLLMMAANYGHERMVEMLLRHGAEIDMHSGGSHRTALMAAAKQGHELVVVLLLRHKAEVNLRDGDGMSALMLAAVQNHSAIVLRLLQAGADLAMRSPSGLTALDYAESEHQKECVRVLSAYELSVAARAAEASGAQCPNVKQSLAEVIAERWAEGMLECKVPEEVWRAAERGREATVEAWVDSGGQMDATFLCDGVDGTTMLMLAAGNGHERLVETFLQRGADLGLCDSRGKTALQYARQAGHTECAKLIEEQATAARAAKETEAKRRGETPFGGHGGWALSASHHTPGCA